jgi:acetyl esterase/lipase
MLVPVPADAVEEAKKFNDMVEDLLAKAPSLHTLPPEVTRATRREGRGTFPAPEFLPEFETRSLRGRGGNDIALRVFVPEDPKGAYLHIHGGGWVLGAHDMQDLALRAVADRAGVAVVSVDYRLAPEHPWPAGGDDCEDAAVWFVKEFASEVATDRLVIGGESAGAHLAVVTLVRLRDRHGVRGAFRGANLVYGCYDMSKSPSVRAWGERNLILSGPIVDWFVECFTPGMTTEERKDPDLSPIYADLSDLPPALFTVGTMDMLRDDSAFMAARWEAAGNEAGLRVYPEGIHGFNAFPMTIARLANEAQWEFIADAVK